MRFADRKDAGERLASALLGHRGSEAVVLALPRGGVPVGFEVAQRLGAPLDVLLVRKIGAPGNPEFGIGAIVDATPPQTVLNDALVRSVRPPAGYVEAETERQLVELEHRRNRYAPARITPSLRGRTTIVVDDGMATGGTMRAALRALRATPSHRLIAAIPVAAAETLRALEAEADEIVCLTTPDPFHAVGQAYVRFEQTSDDEVLALLHRAAQKFRSNTGET